MIQVTSSLSLISFVVTTLRKPHGGPWTRLPSRPCFLSLMSGRSVDVSVSGLPTKPRNLYKRRSVGKIWSAGGSRRLSFSNASALCFNYLSLSLCV